MNKARCTRRNRKQRIANNKRPGVILVLFAIMLALLIGMIGLVVDGGLMLASHERAQNIADSTARSVAIALHNGDEELSPQKNGERFAFTYNHLPDDPEMTPAQQVIVNHPPQSGAFAGINDYVEVIITHPMDTNFIQVLGVATHQRVSARAVAGFRTFPKSAGVVILDPRGNPGLSVQGTNAKLQVNSAILVFTRRVGENEFGATVGEFAAGQPSVTMGGAGATMEATELIVSGGVDRWENYVAPAVDVLHAGTEDRVDDPFHDRPMRLPIPIEGNGVINRDLGSVSITNNNQTGIYPENPDSINTYNKETGVTTLHPGIYNQIRISGGEVEFKPGIYVLQNISGGGNILSITGGTVTGLGVMFYNTASSWDPVTGGDDQRDDLAEDTTSETEPFNVQSTQFGGIDIHGEHVHLTGIDTNLYAYFNEHGEPIDEDIDVFNDMVIYQRRFNQTPINITNGQDGGIEGRFYAKWANLQLSGQGTYNFAIVVGSMSVNGRAIVNVPVGIPLDPLIEPVRLVE